MSKFLPTQYTDLDSINYKTRSPIRAEDWRALAAMQNYLYSRRGERIGGIVFQRVWENNTSSFAVESTNSATVKDLDEWVPIFQAKRRTSELSFQAALFTLQVYGTDFEIQAQIIDAEDGITVLDTSLLLSSSTTLKTWNTLNINLKDVEVSKPDGTPRLLALSIQARRRAANAQIYQINFRGKFLAALEIPDREYLWKRYPVIYTFTPAGATGHLGPTQSDVDTAYALLPQNGLVTVISPGYQCFDIPWNGIWKITAAGAGFNGVSNQRGAVASGFFNLSRGEQLRMIVGHVGDNIRCGSGGSFVGLYDRAVSTGNTVTADGIKFLPLVIGGGAGGTLTANPVNIRGQAGLQGGNSSTLVAGGIGPAGGPGLGFAIGGAGWTGNGSGSDGTAPFNVAQSYTNGGEGNLTLTLVPGSFGGGGTGRPTTNYRFGGGGGWGGGAAAQTAVSTGWGGGGASYVNALATSPSIVAGSNIGDGYITVEYVGQ
jgi:hypothetical protein